MGSVINNHGTISGNVNNAGRDNVISSFNTDVERDAFKALSTLKGLIEKENISDEDKECVTDSIEVITEQLNSQEPKKTRIKNAWNTIINLTSKMPAVLSDVSKVKDSIEQSLHYIEQVVGESLPRLPF